MLQIAFMYNNYHSTFSTINFLSKSSYDSLYGEVDYNAQNPYSFASTVLVKTQYFPVENDSAILSKFG